MRQIPVNTTKENWWLMLNTEKQPFLKRFWWYLKGTKKNPFKYIEFAKLEDWKQENPLRYSHQSYHDVIINGKSYIPNDGESVSDLIERVRTDEKP